MSSTGQAQSASQQQQKRVKKPPFADWPTIKILQPPQGRFSRKTDEWCMNFCSQSVSGRIHGKEPNCRTICFRKVFPHEIRNVATFATHPSVDQDGKAKYPLPVEGQSVNVPRFFGGVPQNADDSDSPRSSTSTTKYWEEGWYLWAGKGKWALYEKTHTMGMDLHGQQVREERKEQRKELWQDYQDHLKQKAGPSKDEDSKTESAPNEDRWWGPIVPPRPVPDSSPNSVLIPIPPEFPPFWDRINRLLAPSYHALEITRNSIKSGEHKEFARRVWEKAWSDEPFILASRTFTRAYERWKERDPDEDDSKKGSP